MKRELDFLEQSFIDSEIAGQISANTKHYGFENIAGYVAKGKDSYVLRVGDEVLKFYLIEDDLGEIPSFRQVGEYTQIMNLGADWFEQRNRQFMIPRVSKPLMVRLNPVNRIDYWREYDCGVTRSNFIAGPKLITLGDLAVITNNRIDREDEDYFVLNADMLMVGINREWIDQLMAAEVDLMKQETGMNLAANTTLQGLNIKVLNHPEKITLMVTDLGVSIRDVVGAR